MILTKKRPRNQRKAERNRSKENIFSSAFYVYILQCKDKTLYVGSTNDLEKRLHAHNNLKSGAHYTKIRRPVFCVYSQKLKNYSLARKKEGELKRLSREEKFKLIAS